MDLRNPPVYRLYIVYLLCFSVFFSFYCTSFARTPSRGISGPFDVELPDYVVDIKLFTCGSGGISGAFDLEAFNTGGIATAYNVVFESRNWGAVSGFEPGEAGYPSRPSYAGLCPTCVDTCWEYVVYRGENEYGSDITLNVVKYSTYLWKKIPPIVLKTNSSASTAILDVTQYVVDSSYGLLTIPASFGQPDSIINPSGEISVSWVENTALQFEALSELTEPVGVIVVASPKEEAPYDCDFDGALIKVCKNLVENGYFDSDTTIWEYWPFGYATSMGSYSWESEYLGQSGVLKISQVEGEKIAISQLIAIDSGKWYTARAKIATDIENLDGTQKVYLHLYEYQDGVGVRVSSEAVQPGSGMIPKVNGWRPLSVSFYSISTMVGISIISIMPEGSEGGNLYVDDIELIECPPPVATAYGPTKLEVTNGTFDENIDGWYYWTYGIASGMGAVSWEAGPVGNKEGLLKVEQQAFEKLAGSQFSSSDVDINGAISCWVYSDVESDELTQKVLLVGSFYDEDTSKVISNLYVSIPAGRLKARQWTELKVAGTARSNVFGLSFIVINPADRPPAVMYIDDVQLDADLDTLHYWNHREIL